MLNVLRVLLSVAVLAIAAPALAAPVNYNYDSGNIQIQAFRTDTNALVFDETLDLAPTSFMVFDPVGTPTSFGLGTLDDFSLAIEPNQGPFSLVSPFGPFDMVTIETGTIAPAPGYSTLVSFPSTNPYSITAGPIDIDATYGASNSGGTPGPVTGVPADITGVNNLTGTITLLAGGVQLSLTGLTMGTVSGVPFEETADLSLTANLTFFGSEGPPIPEPATGVLLSLGLVGLAGHRRARRGGLR